MVFGAQHPRGPALRIRKTGEGPYMRGARQFVERFEVGLFVPMHFYPAVAKAEAFAPIARQHGSKFALLSHTGDSIEL